MTTYDDPTSLPAATAVATETVESHAVDDQGYLRPRGDSTNSDFSQSPLNTTTTPLISRHESTSGSISSMTSAASRPAQRHHSRRQIRSLDGHTSSHPPITSRRLSLHNPNRESSFRRASITPSERDMFGLTRGGSIYRGDHYHDDGDGAESPPSSPSHLSTSLQVPSMPTKGLLNSLAAAAHYSGMAAEEGVHERFESPFEQGEDRTQLDPVRQAILDSVLALYCGKPSVEIFSKYWRKDAVFEDPLTLCRGYREYAAQFYGLAKFMSKSVTQSHRILASTTSPNRIVYSQVQEYTFRFMKQKTVRSMVVIHLDTEHKIVKLEDKWKGIDQPHKYGALFFRKLNAKALPLLIKYPKQIASTESVSNLYSPRGASSYPPPPHNAQSTPTSTPPTITLGPSTDLHRLDPISGSDSGSVSSPGSATKETSISQIGAPSGA